MTKPSKQVKQPQPKPPTREEMLAFVLDIGDHMADAGGARELNTGTRLRYRAFVNELRKPDPQLELAKQIAALPPKPCKGCDDKATKGKR
jgi:hypothetical protein